MLSAQNNGGKVPSQGREIGVPSSAALVLSLQLGLLALLVVLPGGILWLLLQVKERAPNAPA